MPVQTLKLVIVAGARPNFMKVAPLMKAIEHHNSSRGDNAILLKPLLVHTGQHYDQAMSDVFFSELGIRPPDINLEVGSGSHAAQTAAVMTGFEQVCVKERPDWVVVVGDVNSTMACTLVCSKMGIRVAHVEAGLRSFDRAMPEEINRIVTDSLADLLLTPSPDADENLRREGVPQSKIRLVGNVMIDTLVANLQAARSRKLRERLGLSPSGYAYVTLHRPANVDEEPSLSGVMAELKRLCGDLPIVFPMHPRTRKMCSKFGITLNGVSGFHVIEPIGYHDSLGLTEEARLVITDSGGLQEETTYFRTPCLTLRRNTERPVTLTLGSNKLTTLEELRENVAGVLQKPSRFGTVPPLWDGRTSGRILQALLTPGMAVDC
jgi:UDP-N-acetylglucosamine 2-epimerase (non-hydrolysing)